MVNTIKIVVDCEENDEEDIKCGGPLYLGFDFYVKAEEVEEMAEFIKETFEKESLSYIGIYYDDELIYEKSAKNVWTKEKIYDCIMRNSDTVTHKV